MTDDLKRVISTDEIHTATAKPSRKEKKNTSAQDQSMTMIWATTFNSSESWIPSNILVRNTLVLMTIVESSVGKIIVTLSYVNEERRGFFTFGQVELEHALGLSGFDFDAKMGHLSFMSKDVFRTILCRDRIPMHSRIQFAYPRPFVINSGCWTAQGLRL